MGARLLKCRLRTQQAPSRLGREQPNFGRYSSVHLRQGPSCFWQNPPVGIIENQEPVQRRVLSMDIGAFALLVKGAKQLSEDELAEKVGEDAPLAAQRA